MATVERKTRSEGRRMADSVWRGVATFMAGSLVTVVGLGFYFGQQQNKLDALTNEVSAQGKQIEVLNSKVQQVQIDVVTIKIRQEEQQKQNASIPKAFRSALPARQWPDHIGIRVKRH